MRAISVTLSKMPLAAREKRPWTVVSGNESGLDGGNVAGDGSQPEPYVRGLARQHGQVQRVEGRTLTPSLPLHQIARPSTVVISTDPSVHKRPLTTTYTKTRLVSSTFVRRKEKPISERKRTVVIAQPSRKAGKEDAGPVGNSYKPCQKACRA